MSDSTTMTLLVFSHDGINSPNIHTCTNDVAVAETVYNLVARRIERLEANREHNWIVRLVEFPTEFASVDGESLFDAGILSGSVPKIVRSYAKEMMVV